MFTKFIKRFKAKHIDWLNIGLVVWCIVLCVWVLFFCLWIWEATINLH